MTPIKNLFTLAALLHTLIHVGVILLAITIVVIIHQGYWPSDNWWSILHLSNLKLVGLTGGKGVAYAFSPTVQFIVTFTLYYYIVLSVLLIIYALIKVPED